MSENYTSGRVASKLGVSLRTIQLWCEAGLIDYIRTPGGHRRFKPSNVQALKEKMDVQATSITSKEAYHTSMKRQVRSDSIALGDMHYSVRTVDEKTQLHRLRIFSSKGRVIGNASVTVTDDGQKATIVCVIEMGPSFMVFKVKGVCYTENVGEQPPPYERMKVYLRQRLFTPKVV